MKHIAKEAFESARPFVRSTLSRFSAQFASVRNQAWGNVVEIFAHNRRPKRTYLASGISLAPGICLTAAHHFDRVSQEELTLFHTPSQTLSSIAEVYCERDIDLALLVSAKTWRGSHAELSTASHLPAEQIVLMPNLRARILPKSIVVGHATRNTANKQFLAVNPHSKQIFNMITFPGHSGAGIFDLANGQLVSVCQERIEGQNGGGVGVALGPQPWQLNQFIGRARHNLGV